MKRLHHPIPILVIGAALLVGMAPGTAQDARSAMADAMVRMMEAMGLFGGASGSFSSLPQGWTNPMGMSGWPAGFAAIPGGAALPGLSSVPGMQGMPGLSGLPGTGAGTTGVPGAHAMTPAYPMGQMGQMMERFGSGGPSGGAGTQNPTVFEGIWESNDDSLLIVQGARYRIYAPFSGYIDGEIRVSGDRVELTNRRESFVQEFEYALDQDRLVLRDRQGQVYLYRRLILDAVR